jgi:hypothetical protein
MANFRKRTVSISTILSAAAFREGYEAAAKGIPFDPDAYKGERHHGFSAPYLYEVGRYFAAHCKAEYHRSLHPAKVRADRLQRTLSGNTWHKATLNGSV